MDSREWKKSFDRIERYLKRIEANYEIANVDENYEADNDETMDIDIDRYEDDLHSFFIYAWHLHDAIAVDLEGNKTKTDIKKEALKHKSLRICSDIANTAKHVLIYDIKEDAKIKDRAIIIRPARPNLKAKQVGKNIRLSWTYDQKEKEKCLEYKISLPDDTELKALEVAREIISDWKKVIKELGLK